MNDANGSRFALLLGRDDWARCHWLDDEGLRHPLRLPVDRPDGNSGEPLDYEPASQSLRLAQRDARFQAPPNDRPPRAADRRGAAADADGNLFWITDGGWRIDVLAADQRSSSSSSASTSNSARSVSTYWDSRTVAPTATEAGHFGPARPRSRNAAPAPRRLRGLAVTAERYLVAGVLPDEALGLNGGLLVFDLIAGGPPLALTWPTGDSPFTPLHLAARPAGGLWLLDRGSDHRRVWTLDRRLGQAPLAPAFTLPLDTLGGDDPVALCALSDSALLVVDGRGHGPGFDSHALISVYERGVLIGRVSTASADEPQASDATRRVAQRAFDAVLLRRQAPAPGEHPALPRLVIATEDGRQALTIDLKIAPAAAPPPRLQLLAVAASLPLRRYGGRGLVAVGWPTRTQDSGLRYDSRKDSRKDSHKDSRDDIRDDIRNDRDLKDHQDGQGDQGDSGAPAWLPLVALQRQRFIAQARLETPLFDGAEAGCTWHRLLVDASLPPGCTLRVASRCADDPLRLADLAWRDEPQPMRRASGSELPWLIDPPGPPDSAAGSRGAWETLLQQAHGRWLQLRLTLAGDEFATPRLTALRAWFGRFCYARHYLPAVYRQDAASADFLARFLANFEGLFTAIEDRVVASRALFDLRCAPTEALDWLAGWLGLVLDPTADDARRRLLIRHAVALYQSRGTPQGIRLALELVCSRSPEPAAAAVASPGHLLSGPLGGAFGGAFGGARADGLGVRLVERFPARRPPPLLLLLDDSAAGLDPRRRPNPARWRATDGAERLHARYRAALQRAGLTVATTLRFAPCAPEAADWCGGPPDGRSPHRPENPPHRPQDKPQDKPQDEPQNKSQHEPQSEHPAGQAASASGRSRAAAELTTARAVWVDFCRNELGSVPGLAADLRHAWQRWRQRQAFDSADLPRRWIAGSAEAEQWRSFRAALATDPEAGPLRRGLARWQAFLARRYRRLDAVLAVWGGDWPELALLPPPDRLPEPLAALIDWLLFETRVEPMAQLAHRFSVLLPTTGPLAGASALAQQVDLVRRIVLLEKPAHAHVDVQACWALFQVGQARLGLDTRLGQGSRAAELAPPFSVGRGPLGGCRTWGVESEKWPQRGQFVPDLKAHGLTMGRKDGAKWTAAADSQPTFLKPDNLLGADHQAPGASAPADRLRPAG